MATRDVVAISPIGTINVDADERTFRRAVMADVTEQRRALSAVGDLGRQTDVTAVNVNLFATGGNGTAAFPWTGWEPVAIPGQITRFPAGYYSTPNIAFAVPLSNTPSLTRIIGDGSASTFITITGATGQFRVYGTGGGTRVLDGVIVTGLTIFAGADNTSAGLASFENFDIGCFVDDIRVDPTASFKVTTAIQVLNCENCHFGMLTIRGRVVTLATAGHIETGLKILTDDGIQRGNMHFAQVHLTDITTGLDISSTGGSLNNIRFAVLKVVNGGAADGTLGIKLRSNCEQIAFGDLHLEVLNNGFDADSIEGIVIENALASQIHNVANTSGTAFKLANCDGGLLRARIDTVFDGFLLSGTTTRMFTQKMAAGAISGAYFTDSSSGINTYIAGNVWTGDYEVSGILRVKGGLSIGTRVSSGSISGGVMTMPSPITSGNLTIDTEAAAASDDLDTINGGFDGMLMTLSAANDTRTVVVKHNTGNIKCGADVTMDNSSDIITLQRVGSVWHKLSFADNMP